MSIKKTCELDTATGRLIGFVDLGHSQEPTDADNVPLATEALVFMVVGIAAPWKMPFGYFLTAGLSGEVLKNLLTEAIHCISECGLQVVAVVCDCLAANVSMAKLLGCRVYEQSFEALKTFFPHPSNEEDIIFMIFDACHGLKLLRNLLGDKGVLLSSTHGRVLWKHLKALQELQEKEGLRAANKLSKSHINYYQQVMKVKLAAQKFRSSVSKALEFASLLKLPGFGNCMSTANFIAMVDRAFDLLNSSNPVATGFKAPLRPSTLAFQRETMEATSLELMQLRLANERLVTQDGRRMSVIALAFTLKSVSQLAEKLLDADMCKYICTRNLNQDPLEMYFSCIRQRGGWNNNPSAVQFRHAYRQTIVNAAVLGSKNANVTAQTEGICLSRSQGQPSSDLGDIYEEQSATLVDALLEHDYFALSEYASEVVRYIGGFVVRATSKHLHCAECAAMLTNDTVTSLLT
ncbi:hypothetical protein HPB49_022146 [Dermacentor silvarum]|uniref:Uncharacterized protein n=1 Tax=Dermacentor silvarum TaxID=543639 RepID=A0ACB8DGF1_DERSI|nr:hypothetical protein HPB49_022146 [Dermacentor silvarum]